MLNSPFFVSEESFRHSSHCHQKLTSSDHRMRLPVGSPRFGVIKNPVNSMHSSTLYNFDHTSAYQPLNHMMYSNDYLLPYRCSICNKGYRSHFGLYHHKQHVHEKKTFPCPICESKFTQKGKVKRHLNTVHKVALCSTCSSILKIGTDYNQHVLYCSK
uniref:C2H2-type domain-containing protein n=1 Tax=Arion vulgaris TaxID=1028688 RepID=A0A0B7AKE3_9EUPU